MKLFLNAVGGFGFHGAGSFALWQMTPGHRLAGGGGLEDGVLACVSGSTRCLLQREEQLLLHLREVEGAANHWELRLTGSNLCPFL